VKAHHESARVRLGLVDGVAEREHAVAPGGALVEERAVRGARSREARDGLRVDTRVGAAASPPKAPRRSMRA
jgi:hypothetical protein